MNDIDDAGLRTALRDRMRAEHPDLEHLAAASLTAGTARRRTRRLRNAGVIGGGAAAIAALAVVTTQLGGGTTAVDTPPPVAAASSVAPGLQVGQVLDLGNDLTGTVATDSSGYYELGGSMRPGLGTGFVVVVDGPISAIGPWWSEGFGTLTEDWPGVTVVVSMATADAMGVLGKLDRAPATVGAGWTCEWFLVDDKASCTSADGGTAGLVIRDAADHDAWAGSPDKGADPSVYTTEVHDGIFISVQAGQGTTSAEVQELGSSLAWVD